MGSSLVVVDAQLKSRGQRLAYKGGRRHYGMAWCDLIGPGGQLTVL